MDCGGGTVPQLSDAAAQNLQQGIAMLLSQWSALQMAVHNEWGGRQSSQLANQLAIDIFSWFTRSKEPLYIDDLENMLDEAMFSLNTVIEDGSIEEVAEKLMIMHEECLEGNYQSIAKLRESSSRPAVSHIRQAADNEDEDDDDDDDDDENMGTDNSSNMIVDAPEVPCSSLNPAAAMPKEEPNAPSSKVTTEADDGWVVVASKRNKGKRT